jgi:hypothetical protein
MDKFYLLIHEIQGETTGIFLFFSEPIPALGSMNLAIHCAQTICTVPAGTAKGKRGW